MKQFFPPPEKLGFCSFGISNRRYRYWNCIDDNSKHKMCPDVRSMVLCHGMSKSRHLQTVSFIMKITVNQSK